MSDEEIKSRVWDTAREAAEKGPGWAQESVVLRDVGKRLLDGETTESKLDLQQRILDAWYDLFAERKLGWGYDLDNPGSPFFHIR